MMTNKHGGRLVTLTAFALALFTMPERVVAQSEDHFRVFYFGNSLTQSSRPEMPADIHEAVWNKHWTAHQSQRQAFGERHHQVQALISSVNSVLSVVGIN